MDLALNNLLWLICHKTQPNQPKQITSKDNNYIYQPLHHEQDETQC